MIHSCSGLMPIIQYFTKKRVRTATFGLYDLIAGLAVIVAFIGGFISEFIFLEQDKIKNNHKD